VSADLGHRLEGLEFDNLLAFLALLGVLRALETRDHEALPGERMLPRIAWDIDAPPVRPRLFVRLGTPRERIVEQIREGLDTLAAGHDFAGRRDLNYSRAECRSLLAEASKGATAKARTRADMLAALMTDAAVKDEKKQVVDATPLCLLYGQGHQHFLERLAGVPREVVGTKGDDSKIDADTAGARCLEEALFSPWARRDYTSSFRWDPEEDVRYALMAGDPTDSTYKTGTQHGANRLAALGLAALTVVPEARAGRVRPAVLGGTFGENGFTFAWPIWRDPASLASIRSLLAHPDLYKPGALAHLGVDHVMATRRISVGKFMNFTRARVLTGPEE
jgi:hypothetical protein